MTVAEMYRLLELKEGAEPAEVKKAYFRLIRRFPPEQNPEAFRKLREAYETLKDGVPKERENNSWITWDNPVVGYLLELADKCDEDEDYDKACGIIEDALKIEPDNVMLHLVMARYQMYGMHPQIAAKYAEFVTKRLPDNREGWMLLANGYQNRGWYKKALPAFQRAYDLGCRESGFLLERIWNLGQNGEKEEASKLFRRFAEETPCNDQTRIIVLETYHRWAEIISPEPDKISEFLRMYDRFAKKEGRKIEKLMVSSPVFVLTNKRMDVIRHKKNRARIKKSIQLLEDNYLITKEMAVTALSKMYHDSVETIPGNLQANWADLLLLVTSISEDDPGLRRYIETDAMLCLLSNLERTRTEIPIIRREYPELAESYAPFLEAAEKGETEPMLKKLKWEFDKLSRDYTGSRYGEMQPGVYANRRERRRTGQERWEDMFNSFLDEESEEPFVREKDKVGRNDPCPCGSGRKFKKCCMGKGIYD